MSASKQRAISTGQQLGEKQVETLTHMCQNHTRTQPRGFPDVIAEGNKLREAWEQDPFFLLKHTNTPEAWLGMFLERCFLVIPSNGKHTTSAEQLRWLWRQGLKGQNSLKSHWVCISGTLILFTCLRQTTFSCSLHSPGDFHLPWTY